LGTEQVIESTSAGEIFTTATATARRFRVSDHRGQFVTGPGPVDMATAFRMLDGMLRTGDSAGPAPAAGLARDR
jgi:hypothetical protein